MPRIFTHTADAATGPTTGCRPLGLKPKEVPLENLSLSRTLGAAPVVSLQITRREPFKYRFHGKRHLPVAAERATGDEGETYVEGLPESRVREFLEKLTSVPTDRTTRAF